MVYDINPMIYNQLGLISMAITVYRLSHFISWNQNIMMYSFHSGFRKKSDKPGVGCCCLSPIISGNFSILK